MGQPHSSSPLAVASDPSWQAGAAAQPKQPIGTKRRVSQEVQHWKISFDCKARSSAACMLMKTLRYKNISSIRLYWEKHFMCIVKTFSKYKNKTHFFECYEIMLKTVRTFTPRHFCDRVFMLFLFIAHTFVSSMSVVPSEQMLNRFINLCWFSTKMSWKLKAGEDRVQDFCAIATNVHLVGTHSCEAADFRTCPSGQKHPSTIKPSSQTVRLSHDRYLSEFVSHSRNSCVAGQSSTVT